MKKLNLLLLSVAMLGATSCESAKHVGGNKMITGSLTYYYALVYSQITTPKYYHIKGWAEYGPDGALMGESGGTLGSYVGIELQLANGDVIYRYEPNLAYELSKRENEEYVTAYGLIG